MRGAILFGVKLASSLAPQTGSAWLNFGSAEMNGFEKVKNFQPGVSTSLIQFPSKSTRTSLGEVGFTRG
jgi:hypothetical protein